MSLSRMLSALGSRYTCVLRLGQETDTADAAGMLTALSPWHHVTGGLNEGIEGVSGLQLQDCLPYCVNALRGMAMIGTLAPEQSFGETNHLLAGRTPHSYANCWSP
jgi:hypothetical protein